MLSDIVWFSLFYFLFYQCFAKIEYNTYRPKIERSTKYVPKVIDKTCLLKPQKGPCRGDVWMYYYEPKFGNCSMFVWGGCQGNGNRFDTVDECVDTCLSKPGHTYTRPNWCSLSFDYGFCFGALKRWYYDSLWKVCKERIYSGCGGNKNNFYNKEQCNSVCLFGTGPLKSPGMDKDSLKKVLIKNPIHATTKKTH